ncbi:uncharacterized protein LOC135091276 isoform X4 [Scylla paramamosain]
MASPPPTPEEKVLAAFPPSRAARMASSEVAAANLTRSLDALLLVMEGPTARCRKLIRQGGNSWVGIYDGDKMVCLDAPSSPTLPTSSSSSSSSCLVYSFGSGGDFTFDAAMSQLGCHVMVFEDTPLLDGLGRHPFKRVTFLHILLSTDEDVHLVKSYNTPSSSPVSSPLSSTPPISSPLSTSHISHSSSNSSIHKHHFFLHRPLDNIMYLLHHHHHQLDYLKIDIDGGEFEALEHSIFKTDILQRTRQLGVEIHLTRLLDDEVMSNPDILTSVIANYTRVLHGLVERGMRLVHFQPNARKPGRVEVAGRTVWVYAEQLWVNTRLRPDVRGSSHLPAEEDFDELEMA